MRKKENKLERVSFDVEPEEAIQLVAYAERANKAFQEFLDSGCMLDGLKWRLSVKYNVELPKSSIIQIEDNTVTLLFDADHEHAEVSRELETKENNEAS